jgi:hypothetical protein
MVLTLWEGSALASTINVDGTICTLVDAITAANTDTASGGCIAGSPADTIVLTAGSTHTLTVENTLETDYQLLPALSQSTATEAR